MSEFNQHDNSQGAFDSELPEGLRDQSDIDTSIAKPGQPAPTTPEKPWLPHVEMFTKKTGRSALGPLRSEDTELFGD